MFQNILNGYIKTENFKEENKKKTIKEIFEIKNVLLYIISFLVSMVGFGELGSPFAFAIFAATCSNNVPSAIVYILSTTGVLLKFGKTRNINICSYYINIYYWNINVKTRSKKFR